MTLSEDSILWALTHLRASGDSDLFPWACELDAFSASAGEVASFLRQKQLSDINPGAARRFMVPKDEVSFRLETQLDSIDSLVWSTLIHEFGSGMERRRTPNSERLLSVCRLMSEPKLCEHRNHCLLRRSFSSSD